jgi:hypothetical protein
MTKPLAFVVHIVRSYISLHRAQRLRIQKNGRKFFAIPIVVLIALELVIVYLIVKVPSVADIASEDITNPFAMLGSLLHKLEQQRNQTEPQRPAIWEIREQFFFRPQEPLQPISTDQNQQP